MSFLEEYILNKLKNFTLVMLIQGYMQMGKSTLAFYLMNNLSRLRGEGDWDYKKYCARNLDEFIDMIDRYENKLLVYEECSKDISINKWYDDLNHFFNIIMQTQAYKHNLICMVFPHVASISNRQRYFIQLGLEIVERIDLPDCKATVFRPTVYKRNFWRLDDNDLIYKWWGSSFVKYSEKDLSLANDYTNWLIGTLKKDVMNDIKRRMKEHTRKFEEKNQIIEEKYTQKDKFYFERKPMW